MIDEIAAADGPTLRAARTGRRLRARGQREHGQGDPARSRSPRAATRASTCWCRSAARPASTPAPWPASWASGRSCIHPDAGLLSAYGIGLADVVRHRVRGRLPTAVAEARWPSCEPVFAATGRRSARGSAGRRDRSRADRSPPARSTCAIGASRPRSRSPAPPDDRPTMRDGVTPPSIASCTATCTTAATLEIVAARVEVVGHARRRRCRVARRSRAARAAAERTADAPSSTADRCDDAASSTATQLRPGDRIRRSGHRLRTDLDDGRSIPAGRPKSLSGGELLRQPTNRTPQRRIERPSRPTADPVMLEIFNNHFAAIAEQMGITLRNTSSSVNVKERLDFSCAVFTPDGRPGRQRAAHSGPSGGDGRDGQPHHRRQSRACGRATCSSPTTLSRRLASARRDRRHAGARRRRGRLLFFTASRAHHAEIGGIVPGSMPPFSQNLAEEGVLIRNFKLVDAGTAALGRACDAAAWPALSDARRRRQPGRHRGPGRRQSPAARATWRGWSSATRSPVVEAYMRHIQAAAEQKMRQALARLRRRQLSVSSIISTTARRSPSRSRSHGESSHDRLHRHRPGAAPAI